MSNNKEEIGANLDQIKELLEIEESANGNSTPSIEYAWYVGATASTNDYSDEYIDKGIWLNRYTDKFIDEVKSVAVGDRIVIKAKYNQKKNLPFNNNGKTVGAMKLKAIGIVTENMGDGKELKVDWTKLDPVKVWYGQGTVWETIKLVKANESSIKKALLDFTFLDKAQDYTICEEYYREDPSIEGNDIIEEDMDEEDYYIDLDNAERMTGGENVIIYGVPGAGKSYTIERYYKDENTEMQRLVFHPDYTYSDFVGQILPQSKDGDVTYEFIPGPFTKILKYAHYNPEKKFMLVIEEINRGNAPAIFGDVFQLLDREKDGRSSYEIANADIAKIVYNDENHPVYLPSNLSIICTMNTSDQNVFTLDTAFQRRWNMRLIENKFKKDTPEEKAFAEHPILDSDIKWEAFCETINAQILDKNQNMTSAEDKRLGTHFVTIDDLIYDENERNDNISDAERTKATLNNRRFPEKVIKYLWDDAFKFYRDEIFKGEYNSLEKVIHEFTTKSGNDRFNIFKDNIKAAIEEANTRS